MSRSVRDLRELICMSRLSYHGEEDNHNSFLSTTKSKKILSTNPVSKETTSITEFPSNAVKKNSKTKVLSAISFPLTPGSSGKQFPLPPIRKSPSGSSESSSPFSSGRTSPQSPSSCEMPSTGTRTSRPISSMTRNYTTLKTNFDSLLSFFDATVLGDWLTRANKTVAGLTSWLHAGDNCIKFANFWLTQVSPSKRSELVAMEYSIVIDELQFAFRVGLQDREVTSRDLSTFMSAVLWEYPQKFASTESGAYFVDLLMCLCCGRKHNYKALLADVKCSTSNKQYVQFILATRAFAIVNFCSGVIDFYKQIHSLTNSSDQEELAPSNQDINLIALDFAFQAVQKGYVEVFEYFVLNYDIKPDSETADGKSFLFAAILSGQVEVLRYIVKIQPQLDVNKISLLSGNTPLHAAVNTRNIYVVKLLVEAGADVNAWNSECECATPLHWAILNGSNDLVSYMLSVGCDPTVKMGVPATVTPLHLAKDLGLDDVVSLLENACNSG